MANTKSTDEYARKLKKEKAFFESKGSYTELPDISHYWANKYLQPRVRNIFGTTNNIDFYIKPIAEKATRTQKVKVMSLGSGNGKVEKAIASAISSRGISNVSITGIEYSEKLVASANDHTGQLGLTEMLEFKCADFNDLQLDPEWDFVIANQILHHVTNLEGLFDQIHFGLVLDGLLLTRDTIGKNGHQAWPECKELIEQIWQEMPTRYKFNKRRNKHFEEFPDLDLSSKSFEGIRAQDILPQLLQRFSFTHFYAYGGITERFLNRGFGPNFDVSNDDDRVFVTSLELINDLAIESGRIKPTQMLAYAGKEQSSPVKWNSRTPEKCVRLTGPAPDPS